MYLKHVIFNFETCLNFNKTLTIFSALILIQLFLINFSLKIGPGIPFLLQVAEAFQNNVIIKQTYFSHFNHRIS